MNEWVFCLSFFRKAVIFTAVQFNFVTFTPLLVPFLAHLQKQDQAFRLLRRS